MGPRTTVALCCLVLAACRTPEVQPLRGVDANRLRVADGRPRVLAVVAHPDDEVAFSGTMFKTATHLGGACDLFVITNGEAGYKYSTLGEIVYNRPLTDPAIGRAELPGIRKRELLAAADVLRLRTVYLLGERDHRYTTDPEEVLGDRARVWDLGRIRAALRSVLDENGYDFVLTHQPSPRSHGHHQAATILALEAVAAMPAESRPVVLAASSASRGGPRRARPAPIARHPITEVRGDVGPWAFDRAQRFGYKDQLDYHAVVNWAIASHRSQGTYQGGMNRSDLETFRLYALDVPDAAERAARWFERLAEPQFPSLAYDDDGDLSTAEAAAETKPDDPPRVTALGGLFLGSPDPAALSGWYKDRFALTPDDTGALAFRWRDAQSPARSGVTLLAPVPQYGEQRGLVIQLNVLELDRHVARLREAGVEVSEVDVRPDGRAVRLRDPDGNALELFEPAPDGWALR
jgi:LmbE family N-acetylglucosaminyl deacetylase